MPKDKAPKTIHLYINSPGGSVTAGMSIYDTMQFIKSPIHTTVMGIAASMGSFLAMAGEKGKRAILPHARHMIHQPSGGASGMASDVEIQYKELFLELGGTDFAYIPCLNDSNDHISLIADLIDSETKGW